MTFAAAVRSLVPAAVFLLCIGASPPLPAQADDVQDASQLFKQGQLDRALDRINAFLARNPKDARGRFLKGIILTEQKKSADAIKVFTDLTQDFPELPEPYNNLAVLYASQGQYDKARVALEMAIRTHPSYATAHENLGDIYAKMAGQAYDKALQLDKSNTTAQTKLNLIRDLLPGARSIQPTGTGPATARVANAGSNRVEPAKPARTAPPPVSAAPPVVKGPDAPAQAETPRAPEPPRKATVAKAEKTAPVRDLPAATAPAESSAPRAAEPARKEAPAKQASTTAPARDPEAVVGALKLWARAWSGNDVEAYLARYAPDFRTPKGESRSEWESQRRSRIEKPREIEVEIDSPKVTFTDPGRATVTFRQRYESGNLKLNSNKTMVMVKTGDRWLIQEERVGN